MPVPQKRSVVGRTLLRDRAHAVLRDAIVDGTLTPGEQLRDSELQEWIGVSRTPIREALMRLERSGLVRTLPGRSTVVMPLEDERVTQAVPVVAAMHALAAELAAHRVDAEAVEEMRQANEEFARALAVGDADAALQADDHLHDVVVRLAENPVLADTLELHGPLVRRAERLRFADAAGAGRATHDSHGLHARLIEALAGGDGEAAAEAARATWNSLHAAPPPDQPMG
ncbi:GntR family transcriptional regulator [Kytococcus sedentarius]|uniref:GntR family transcriptional regulator n=1 Tax=Kytococcus sedentarius TaxID=1276 RepID=UPI0035BC6D73